MKLAHIIFILSFMFITSCNTQKIIDSNIQNNKMIFEPNDDGEYDIIVMDSQYETFLMSIAKPKSFYTEDYYKSKNKLYVSIWNQRHMNPFKYNPDIYAVSINIDPTINYGLEFEYKLYNFFKFMEWKYSIRFI